MTEWWWLAGVIALTALGVAVILLVHRRSAVATASQMAQTDVLSLTDAVDEDIAPDVPLSGVLVPQEDGSVAALGSLVASELDIMRHARTRYAALPRNLVPELSPQRKLGHKNIVAIALRELTQAIRHGHKPTAGFETVQAFTANMPKEEMIKSATSSDGLRGLARNAGRISKQNFFPKSSCAPSPVRPHQRYSKSVKPAS